MQQTLDELDAVRAVLAAGGPPEDTATEAGRWALADAVAVWGQRLWRSDLAALARLRREVHAATARRPPAP